MCLCVGTSIAQQIYSIVANVDKQGTHLNSGWVDGWRERRAYGLNGQSAHGHRKCVLCLQIIVTRTWAICEEYTRILTLSISSVAQKCLLKIDSSI